MLQIISGFWISRSVYVIGKLGIPDLLQTGPKTAEELAAVTNTDAHSLFRILRALVSVGVLNPLKADASRKHHCPKPSSLTHPARSAGSRFPSSARNTIPPGET